MDPPFLNFLYFDKVENLLNHTFGHRGELNLDSLIQPVDAEALEIRLLPLCSSVLAPDLSYLDLCHFVPP